MKDDNKVALTKHEAAIDRLRLSNEKALGGLRADMEKAFGEFRTAMEKNSRVLLLEMAGVVGLGVAILAFILK
ncbi:MAG: hypothetical protein OXF05_05635 [Hyphomicrobiales bacterium]|nr:hypothetical protein [Hyphomicrobiales bacterium]MCY4032779.1 hypothetical protein [Hyphomicrobiales bacterium]MCY4038974.1 hypothetical protein [Hyphomicrobiales bacterium]